MTGSPSAAAETRSERQRAAQRWWPERLRLLLIAEAPPSSPDRYFYFEHVAEQDSLFRYVCLGVLGQTPSRTNKDVWLGRLRDAGVGLVDVSLDPLPYPGAPLEPHVEDLVDRVRALSAESVVLIKATVYDSVLRPLTRAGIPVVGVRVPFPGSGQQRRFEAQFALALAQTPLASGGQI